MNFFCFVENGRGGRGFYGWEKERERVRGKKYKRVISNIYSIANIGRAGVVHFVLIIY